MHQTLDKVIEHEMRELEGNIEELVPGSRLEESRLLMSDDRSVQFKVMLQDRIVPQINQDYDLLNSELKQYRKVNHSLRKKIKEKDFKIHQLFGYIQDAGKQFGLTPEPSLLKSQPHERHYKLTQSDGRKKEKQNKNMDSNEDSNIFKHPSYHAIGRIGKEEVHLPALEKKTKNIFSLDESPDNPEKKGRVIRIAIERLKPLDSEQVRKRFLLKYGRAGAGNE